MDGRDYLSRKQKDLTMTVLKTALLGIVLFAQSGFALPAFDLAAKQLENRLAHSPRAHSGVVADCANFSGKWKGQCTANGASEASEVAIEQTGCTSLKMGTEVTQIGALSTTSQGFPIGDKALMLGFTSSNDWNADASQLRTGFGGIIKVLGSREHVPVNGYAVTKLDGGKLVIEAQVFDIKVSCTYDKQ